MTPRHQLTKHLTSGPVYFVAAMSLAVFHSSAAGQTNLAAPDDWRGETIQLPPRFAPNMSFTGVEHIRFAPGMFNPQSETFFTYALVFELTGPKQFNQKTLELECLKYYRGLCKAVAGKRLPDLDTSEFELALKPETKDQDSELQRYYGTLSWIEPFQTLKQQTLRLELQTWADEDQAYIFACVSPQERSTKIWQVLRQIRSDYIATHPAK